MGGERTDNLLLHGEAERKGTKEKGKERSKNSWPSSCHRERVVECWIGVGQEGDRRVVRLAGWFGEAQVPELMQVCAAGGPLSIDLTELVSTDAAGLEAISRIREQGAMITGAPTYIQLRLDSVTRKPRSSKS
jgi:hypothetical protein